MSTARRPTVVDVARAASVSVGTVSNVVSGARAVRPETRERVERAIAELGFRPNTIARALIRRRTQTVGMVIPDVTNPFFSDLIWEVERALTEADYAVVFGNSANDPARERQYLEAFLSRRVDALVVVVTAGADLEFVRSLAAEVPTVFVDRLVPPDVDSVVGDNDAGMALVVDHLVGLGHGRVALVNGDAELETARAREAGAVAALARHGLEPVSRSTGAFTLESGDEQGSALFAGAASPTAVVAANDLLAMGVLAAASRAGLAVPGDVSVTGYDDIAYAAFTSPPLTTVRQPARAMGEEAARLLLARLEGDGSPPRRRVVEPELRARASAAAPPDRQG
ncbi:MAG TPA: LacI family DNA-binding transcriptional regulator [Gaiellaceae bacterium]|nr:LacI family DNA-binding transcriptional regulator [Gaiellaceae bacterium]